MSKYEVEEANYMVQVIYVHNRTLIDRYHVIAHYGQSACLSACEIGAFLYVECSCLLIYQICMAFHMRILMCCHILNMNVFLRGEDWRLDVDGHKVGLQLRGPAIFFIFCMWNMNVFLPCHRCTNVRTNVLCLLGSASQEYERAYPHNYGENECLFIWRMFIYFHVTKHM